MDPLLANKTHWFSISVTLVSNTLIEQSVLCFDNIGWHVVFLRCYMYLCVLWDIFLHHRHMVGVLANNGILGAEESLKVCSVCVCLV